MNASDIAEIISALPDVAVATPFGALKEVGNDFNMPFGRDAITIGDVNLPFGEDAIDVETHTDNSKHEDNDVEVSRFLNPDISSLKLPGA